MRRPVTSLVWIAFLSALSGKLVWAQSSIYFNRASFLDASQTVPGYRQGIDSSSVPPFGGPIVSISNVTFTGRYLLTAGSSLSAGYAMYNFDSDIPLSVHFANGARAFGGDFSSLLSPTYSSFTATLLLDNNELFTFTAQTDPNSTFFGFISPTPVTHLTFSDGGLFGFSNLHEELIANLYMVTEIPEPRGVVFLILSLVIFLFRRRR